MTPVETKNTKSSGIEIEIQLDTDDAHAKLDNLAVHITAVNELLDRTLNRLDRAAQILPQTSLEAVRAMRYGLPPTENYMRSLAEMLKISCPLVAEVNYFLRTNADGTCAGRNSSVQIKFAAGDEVKLPIDEHDRIGILAYVSETVCRYAHRVSPDS